MEMTPTDVYSILFGVPGSRKRLDPDTVLAIYLGYRPVLKWLTPYDDPAPARRRTFLAYEKEVLRFYVWLTISARKPLHLVDAADLTGYAAFLSNPLPARYWIGTRRSRPTAAAASTPYLPFGGPLSSVSIRYALNIVCLMLRESDVSTDVRLPATVKAMHATKVVHARTEVVSEEFCRCVSAIADAMPAESIFQKRARARLQFLIELFQSTGIQTGEALAARMGDIFEPSAGPNQSNDWVLRIATGLPRQRLVPLGALLWSKFIVYVDTLGLPQPPYLPKHLPLILRAQSNCLQRPLTRQQLHFILRPILLEAQATLYNGNEPVSRGALASGLWSRFCAASCLLQPLAASANDLARGRLPHLSDRTLAKIVLCTV